jgi:hypothetical protein
MGQVGYVTRLATWYLFLSFHALTMPLAKNARGRAPGWKELGQSRLSPYFQTGN